MSDVHLLPVIHRLFEESIFYRLYNFHSLPNVVEMNKSRRKPSRGM
jgi:hypothetical protein